ncbi:hypothetical protein EV652_11994 [Kribbella steppae]|uniref:Uncharacterized protein n=1 Tax=Kribbella steppae TaxID=2512223 RepID=A0A4R2GZM6_9ACTN|nr:hypothetical protein [Kribbella steppae]TCO16905.1 hypothetical protein EV652_11994 [Kribbella steppae]
MSTYPGQASPRKNKTLTWLAIACFVVGLGLTGFFTYRIVATAPRTPEPIEAGVVHLDAEGLTVYASVPVLTPPCQAKDSSGADVPLKAPTGSEQITVNSETWYVVARSVDRVPAGDYTISCTDEESGATYAAGQHMSVGAFVVSIFGAIGSLLIFFGLGVVFLVVGAVKNRRRNRPGDTFPGSGPGQGAPGNYPPPGSTFPTQPPGTTFPPYNPGPNPDRPQDR